MDRAAWTHARLQSGRDLGVELHEETITQDLQLDISAALPAMMVRTLPNGKRHGRVLTGNGSGGSREGSGSDCAFRPSDSSVCHQVNWAMTSAISAAATAGRSMSSLMTPAVSACQRHTCSTTARISTSASSPGDAIACHPVQRSSVSACSRRLSPGISLTQELSIAPPSALGPALGRASPVATGLNAVRSSGPRKLCQHILPTAAMMYPGEPRSATSAYKSRHVSQVNSMLNRNPRPFRASCPGCGTCRQHTWPTSLLRICWRTVPSRAE